MCVFHSQDEFHIVNNASQIARLRCMAVNDDKNLGWLYIMPTKQIKQNMMCSDVRYNYIIAQIFIFLGGGGGGVFPDYRSRPKGG